jgi:hypothetical protein
MPTTAENNEWYRKSLAAWLLPSQLRWRSRRTAGAEPSVFNDLSCSCPETVSNGGSSAEDQFNRGILAGLAGGPVVETQQ